MQYTIENGEVVWVSTAVDPSNPTTAEKKTVTDLVAADTAKASMLAGLRAPVVVEGVTFPVLRADMGFYGATHAARNNANMAYPLPLLGDDGVIVAQDADDIDRVYNAILKAIATRAAGA